MVFKAGRLKEFENSWKKLTSDCQVLDIALHCHIEFYNNVIPIRTELNRPMIFSKKEEAIIDNEVKNLKEIGVLEKVEDVQNMYLSPIFVVPKKDGEYRMILNLKDLNFDIVYHHFKMETFETALKLIKPNCYMASIDIRHAYYSVPIAHEHRKFLCFKWKNEILQYTCLPNGISCAPRYFTKLLKPVYATLRKLGHLNMGYIDDSLLVADEKEECVRNVNDTKQLFEMLGFIIHNKKSVFIPAQKIQFLGFIIDSIQMIVTLPEEKIVNLISECRKLYNKQKTTIRDVAKVIGILISVFPAVQYGQLHYRQLEREKIENLNNSKGNFDTKMKITDSMKVELKWWLDNIKTQFRIIDQGTPKMVITSDASSLGWGAVCNGAKIGGRWNDDEKVHHINYLELLAVFHALKAFCKNQRSIHIGLRIDNTCAISYVKHCGGIKSLELNDLARDIWFWCIDRDIWISANYVPSCENIADAESRKFNENIEWMLNADIFKQLVEIWGIPDIDLFATRLNTQLALYSSWKPDPGCKFIDAFSESWCDLYCYIFPPFSLLGRVVQKLRRDQAEGIVVVPMWPTQSWFSDLMQLVIDNPIILPMKNLLTLPQTDKVHPLQEKLKLIACRVSGKVSKSINFRQKQVTLSSLPGEKTLSDNIQFILGNGQHIVIKDRLIHFSAL